MRREHPWRSSLLDPSRSLSLSSQTHMYIRTRTFARTDLHKFGCVRTPMAVSDSRLPFRSCRSRRSETPVSARLHSHSLGNSYTDYIHCGPIISVEKRTILTRTGHTRRFRDSVRQQREILRCFSMHLASRNKSIPHDKLTIRSRNPICYIQIEASLIYRMSLGVVLGKQLDFLPTFIELRYIEIRCETLDSLRCKTKSITIFLKLLGDSPNATRSFPLRDCYIRHEVSSVSRSGYMNISIWIF